MHTKGSLLFIILFLLTTLHAQDKPYIMAHFMPWNVAPPVASNWGWHWTMNHFNPDNMDADGTRDIASHYYPLTGPYDSMDPDVMEYQVLLMKMAGIDGIIVDWYGSTDLWDYPGIDDRTHAMFEYIEKAGLKFSICYEDQTIPNLINQNVINEADKLLQGQEDIKYLEDTWFTKEAHLKLDDKPVLLNFGPQFFKSTSDWNTIFSALDNPPLFFTEDNRVAPAVGAFSWPPMWKAPSDGELTQASLLQYLQDFSRKSKIWEYRVSSAFPGFNDIYKEAGISNGYALLDADGGSTWQLTLEQALSDNPHIIQLVTWNDYGEGTIIEPTQEFGYLYLEMLQDFIRENIDPDFVPNHYHLLLPMEIYELRQAHPGDADINAKLDKAFDLIVNMQPDSAEALLDVITAVEHSSARPASFELRQNYPNPFNPSTTIQYQLLSAAHVSLAIYNAAGQRVEMLYNDFQPAGNYKMTWNAQHAASGVYYFVLQTDAIRLTRKALLMR